MARLADIPKEPIAVWRTDVDPRQLVDMLEWWDREMPGGVELDPDFQRGHVWTPAQRSAWMEHVLQGGMGGRELTFNCPRWQRTGCKGPIVLVDGKQRIETVRKWLSGRLPAFGRKIEEWEDWKTYGIRAQLLQVRMHVLETRTELLGWYLRHNGGGTPHTRRELERVQRMMAGQA